MLRNMSATRVRVHWAVFRWAITSRCNRSARINTPLVLIPTWYISGNDTCKTDRHSDCSVLVFIVSVPFEASQLNSVAALISWSADCLGIDQSTLTMPVHLNILSERFQANQFNNIGHWSADRSADSSIGTSVTIQTDWIIKSKRIKSNLSNQLNNVGCIHQRADLRIPQSGQPW